MRYLLAPALLLLSLAGYSQSSFTVHFDFNEYQLTPTAKQQLDSFLLESKKWLSLWEVRLSGHCDATGTDQYNIVLSKKRVATVKNYLLTHGVYPISFAEQRGYGETQPLNQNSTEEERRLNRRVEISFVAVQLKKDSVIGTLKEKIADSSATIGTNIVLRNINFVGGMHQLLPESQPMLDELLEVMRDNPSLIIRIEGHICCQAGPGDGPDLETGLPNLSEARAKAVMDYLLDNGIAENRVSYKGFGHSSPIYSFPEKSEEEMKLNRRVEIKIISK